VDRQVDQVVLCCSRADVKQAEALAEELGLPVDILDPAASAPSGFGSQAVAADSLPRFASVLGMALSEADRRPPIVDFANVRRRPEAQRFTQKQALAAAAAAIVILGIGGNLWLSSWRSARELANVQNEIQILEQSKKQYEQVVARADGVERWLSTDVNWLDELEQAARRVRPKPFSDKDFPVNDDVVVTQLMMFRPPGINAEGGRMDVQAVAKNASAVADLEDRLRDTRHRVEGGGGQQDSTVPGYPWAFGLQVHVAPPEDALEGQP
jgi:hypothetical protein